MRTSKLASRPDLRMWVWILRRDGSVLQVSRRAKQFCSAAFPRLAAGKDNRKLKIGGREVREGKCICRKCNVVVWNLDCVRF